MQHTELPQIEPYRILHKLGEGGTGNVYLATHPQQEGRFAIKVLHPELIEKAELVRRFLDLAEALKGIDHPNVTRVLEHGMTPDDQPYLVMELLEGRDLGDLLSEAPALDPEQVVAIARQVSEALRAIHEAGIVHADIKPGNIFILEGAGEPRVKLLDFGLGRLGSVGPSDRLSDLILMPGTPEYWSPEQACGQQVGHLSDIYSLGVVMFEALSGNAPFTSHSVSDLVTKHLHLAPAELVPPAGGRPIPEALRSIVRRCLSKEPARRFASAAELSAALERARRPQDPPAVTAAPAALPPPRRGRRWLLVAGPALVLLLGAALALGLVYGRRDGAEARAVQPEQVMVVFTSQPSGAFVYRASGGPPLGRTPATVPLARSRRSLSVLFRFPNGSRHTISFVPDRSTSVHAQAGVRR